MFDGALGSLGHAVRAVAQATHSLTCGVPDRESNVIKYLREATEVIQRWQQQLQDGQSVSKAHLCTVRSFYLKDNGETPCLDCFCSCKISGRALPLFHK